MRKKTVTEKIKLWLFVSWKEKEEENNEWRTLLLSLILLFKLLQNQKKEENKKFLQRNIEIKWRYKNID